MKAIACFLIVCRIVTFATPARAEFTEPAPAPPADTPPLPDPVPPRKQVPAGRKASFLERERAAFAHPVLLTIGSVVAGVGAGAAIGGGVITALTLEAANVTISSAGDVNFGRLFLAGIEIVGFAVAIAGSAAVVTGVVLMAVGAQPPNPHQTSQVAKPAVTLMPTLQPLPGGAAVGIVGTFGDWLP